MAPMILSLGSNRWFSLSSLSSHTFSSWSWSGQLMPWPLKKKTTFFSQKVCCSLQKKGRDVSRVCSPIPEFFTLSSQQSLIELSVTWNVVYCFHSPSMPFDTVWVHNAHLCCGFSMLFRVSLLEGLIQSQAQEIDLPAFCIPEHDLCLLSFFFSLFCFVVVFSNLLVLCFEVAQTMRKICAN